MAPLHRPCRKYRSPEYPEGMEPASHRPLVGQGLRKPPLDDSEALFSLSLGQSPALMSHPLVCRELLWGIYLTTFYNTSIYKIRAEARIRESTKWLLTETIQPSALPQPSPLSALINCVFWYLPSYFFFIFKWDYLLFPLKLIIMYWSLL